MRYGESCDRGNDGNDGQAGQGCDGAPACRGRTPCHRLAGVGRELRGELLGGTEPRDRYAFGFLPIEPARSLGSDPFGQVAA